MGIPSPYMKSNKVALLRQNEDHYSSSKTNNRVDHSKNSEIIIPSNDLISGNASG